MHPIRAIRRPAGILPWLASVVLAFLQDITAATSVATGQQQPAPATMPQRRVMIAPRLRPRTIQLCIRCRQNPAGFWVSRTSDQTARRPWCLSCCQQLDQTRYHVIPFDGHRGAGQFQSTPAAPR